MTNYQEQYRPQFHFSPAEKWMNDPNGMVYFEGEYHLFYQYHPYGVTWGPMHWGHAVSTDLIHWEHLPIALYPDEHGQIFSGSAVVDWQNTTGFFEGEQPGLVAIFTSAGTFPGTDKPRQRQSLAYSSDRGRTWTVFEGNPVLADERFEDYRDPKVFWHEETSKWVMVLATGQTITIYTSDDLKEWAFASEFGEGEGSHDGVWECPDLFKLSIDGDSSRERWVMLVSIGDDKVSLEGSRTQYFIGEFDGVTFTNENEKDVLLWLDYGRDNYAGVSWSDVPSEDRRRIYMGWMSNWRYANEVPTEGWRSAMTLPRELFLVGTAEGVRLGQKVVEEFAVLRSGGASEARGVVVAEGAPVEVPVPTQTFELMADFAVEEDCCVTFGIAAGEGGASAERTVIGYDARRAVFFVDRRNSGDDSFSSSFATVQEAPLAWPVGSLLDVHIVVDACSVEVFAAGGKVALTSLIFPTKPYQEVVIAVDQGEILLKRFVMNGLESIWS